MATIDEQVRQIIKDQLGVSEEELQPGAKLDEDLGADSLDSFELALQLEEEFDITISDEEVSKMKTVKQVIEYVEANHAAKLQ